MLKFYFGSIIYDAECDPNDPFKSILIKHPIYNSRVRSIPLEAGRIFDDCISDVDSLAVEEDILQVVRKIPMLESR